MTLILIKTAVDGVVTQVTLPTAQIINVEANAHYTVIDSTTGKAPESLQIVKTNNDLIIQQGTESTAEELVKIDKFFEAETEASFAADGSSQLANTTEGNLITSSSEAFAPSVAGESSLVWEGAAVQSGISAGASSAGVISNTLLYSLAGGAAGLTAAGIAVASSSSDSSSRASTPAPSVVISDDTTDTAIGDVTYTFTFSEVVNGFTVDDITISGGTAGTLSTSDNITYSLIVTPTSDSTADITVDITADVATDLAGNGNTVAATNTQTVDTELPIATVTSSDTDITNTESVAVQSSETGTAYLVHSSVIVTDLASITAADDELWNSVDITSVNTDFDLSAEGLSGGEYTLYTADAAGNLDADTDNLVSVTDISIVAFYFNERESSDHSGRTFDVDVSYTIYFVIEDLNSASTYFNINDDSIWTWEGADSLGDDDSIIFVGINGSAGFDNDRDFTTIQANLYGIDIEYDNGSGVTAKFILGESGALTTFSNGNNISSGDLWSGRWDDFNVNLGSQIPDGVLTSQGLA